jgi:hypothetical protein
MSRENRNPANLEYIAGKALFTPQGETGAINLGDIELHKQTNNVETKEAFFHPPTAVKTVVRQDVIGIKNMFELTLREHTKENDMLILFGSLGELKTQAAAAEQSVTIEGVSKRREYQIGKYNVSNVAVKVAQAAKIVGLADPQGVITPANADVVLDPALGTIYVREGGTIAEDADLTVTFDCAAVSMVTILPLTHPQRFGAMQIAEFDGEDLPARRIHRFECQLNVKDLGERSTDDTNKFTIEVTVTGGWSVEQSQ